MSNDATPADDQASDEDTDEFTVAEFLRRQTSSSPDIGFDSDQGSNDESHTVHRIPEDYTLEGHAREGVVHEKRKRESSWKCLQVKQKRNRGETCTTETNIIKPARNVVKNGCCSEVCEKRGLECSNFSQERRLSINMMYYLLADLHEKRVWLASMVETTDVEKDGLSRKAKTILYHFHRHQMYVHESVA